MNEFMLLFRRDIKSSEGQPSPEKLQALAKQWQDWMGAVAAQDKFVSAGNRLSQSGRVIKPGNAVINGPYAEIKEALAGYIVVKAKDYDEAVSLAKGCPILQMGGNVEVRQFIAADDNVS
jgi:hypothetical protein